MARQIEDETSSSTLAALAEQIFARSTRGHGPDERADSS